MAASAEFNIRPTFTLTENAMTPIRPLFVLILTFFTLNAQAQVVIRCVDANGKVSYRDSACDKSAKKSTLISDHSSSPNYNAYAPTRQKSDQWNAKDAFAAADKAQGISPSDNVYQRQAEERAYNKGRTDEYIQQNKAKTTPKPRSYSPYKPMTSSGARD